MKIAKYILPALMVTMAACSSDKATAPGGKLSAAERQALQTLMTKPAFINAILGGSPAAAQGAMMMPFVATSLNSIGTFSVGGSASANIAVVGNGVRPQVSSGQSYRAFGGQFSVKVNQQSMVWTGIIALNNLSNPTDIITAGVSSINTSTRPGSIGSTNMNGDGNTVAYGSYVKFDGQNATSYGSTSGKVEFTKISGNSGTGCPGVAQNPVLKVCQYGNGTFQGKFNFTAKQLNGAATVTVPETAVNIPGVILNMEIAY